MATATRAQRLASDATAFVHLLDNVAELDGQAPLRLALGEASTTRFTQFMALDDGLIRQLNYNDAATGTVKTLSPIEARQAILLRWFVLFKQEESRLAGITIGLDDIPSLTADELDAFVQVYSTFVSDDMDRADFFAKVFPITGGNNPTGNNTTSTTTPGFPPTAQDRIYEFKKSLKLGSIAFPDFDGAEDNWFSVRTEWETTFELEGVLYVVSPTYVVPTVDPVEVELHGMHNSYIYLKLFSSCKSGQARSIALTFTATKDGRGLWNRLIDHYQRPEIVDSVYTSCLSAVTSFKLKDFSGHPRKFLTLFSKKLSKIAEIAHFIPTKHDLDDSTKISYLETAIGTSSKAEVFRQQVDTVKTILRTGTGIAPSYDIYYSNLMDAANRYSPPGSRVRSNALRSSGDPPKWKKDFTIRVPKEIFQKMSKTEQDKRRKAQKAAREARSANGQDATPSATTTPVTSAQISALTTAINNLRQQSDAPVTGAPSDDASISGALLAPFCP